MISKEKERGLPVIALLVLAMLGAEPAIAEDRHAGYYYPEPTTSERYEARVPSFPESSRRSRVAFVTGITAQASKLGYRPDYAVFAKGGDAEKLIIVGLDDGRYNTLYRMRALLAMMTAMARSTPIFQRSGEVEDLTFLDMLKMLGFTQVTISDGHKVAHQIFVD